MKLARQLPPKRGMTLAKYVRRDLVILPSTASAQTAARALEESGVGSILICDAGALVGIVTARDIALRVAGRGLNPTRSRLFEVMTRDVATLPPDASAGEAGRLMLERRVRHVPLTEGPTAVGIVTLEDLMLDEELGPSMIAAVLRATKSGAIESRLQSCLWPVPASGFSEVA